MAEYRLTAPLKEEDAAKLRIGDKVLLSGVIYTARDAAHKRIVESLDKNEKPPMDLKGSVIYYVGPTPPREGKVIGAAGPTTAMRMDAYAPRLMQEGMKGMIAKGKRNDAVKKAIVDCKAVYFGATGGAGALLARTVISAEVIAYEDLGPEAVVRLEVVDMPLFVINDMYGNDLYEEGMERYRG